MKKKQCLAEFVGTFFLVLIGTGAIVFDETSNNTLTNFGIALAFGFAVFLMIYFFGKLSGAHINPAVTIGFWIAGRFSNKDVIPYLLSQFSGAILASFFISIMFIEAEMLGNTIPKIGIAGSFLTETLITFALVYVILRVSAQTDKHRVYVPLIVGAVVATAAFFAGPYTGASMNPARSFGPSFLTNDWTAIWLYMSAPFLGAFMAVIMCKVVYSNNCCPPKHK